MKITNERFDLNITNLNFTRIDDYINTKTSIRFSCKLCNKIYKKKPKEIKKLKCNCVKHQEKYMVILENKNIILLQNYINIITPILHQCLICENIFKVKPKSIVNSKNNCSFCLGIKMNNEIYSKRLPNDIILCDEYINTHTKLKHKCLKCNNYWFTKPNYILHMKCGCPICNLSKGEKTIIEILNRSNINFTTQYIVNINNINYRFDFYLINLNIFIEYDGIQHFEIVEFFGGEKAFIQTCKNDEIKNKYCMENNIKLIRIPYYVNLNEFNFNI